jgi:hypothetical protein
MEFGLRDENSLGTPRVIWKDNTEICSEYVEHFSMLSNG